jgi:hypothetical protein
MAAKPQRTGRAAGLTALVALSIAFLPASAAARDTFPVMHVGGDDRLGASADSYFDLYGLGTAASPAVVTIQSPPGYGATLTHRAQFILGDAELDTNRGAYKGEFEVASRAAFETDPATAGCADGAHGATWWMVLNGTHGELSVPVAVDRSGPGYRLTICLGSLQKLKLKVGEIYFETRAVFRNPRTAGVYHWNAVVTPAGTDGAPNPGERYELRARSPLPQTIGPDSATYDPVTKTLTVSGKLVAAGSPRVGINVHVYGGATDDFQKQPELGHVDTSGSGSYTFTRRLAKAPDWVYVYVYHYRVPECQGASRTPAGCASESTDGVLGDETRVNVISPTSA